jgi:hypothetical protein
LAYATEQQLSDFHPAASGGTVFQRVTTLNVASRMVGHFAPEPEVEEGETIPADYTDARRDAELFLGRYLWETSGATLASDSLSGVSSTSFTDGKEAGRIIREQMGDYYTGSGKSVPII